MQNPSDSNVAARSSKHRLTDDYLRAFFGFGLLLVLAALGSCEQWHTKAPERAASPPAASVTPPRVAWHAKPGRGTWVEPEPYVSSEAGTGRLRIAGSGTAAMIIVSRDDHPGVVRAAGDLQTDIERVTRAKPELCVGELPQSSTDGIIIGTIGKSPIIDQLIREGKLDVSGVAGRWETFLVTIVDHPNPHVPRALVVTGSDPRGTIFGIYDLSAQMGVSPWHFWDDVPPQTKDAVYVLPGRHTLGEPAVKYRGFFINDESPSLDNWVPRTFGQGYAPTYPRGFNHGFYAKVFELMLRLKANYLWPAVWSRAFAEDDAQNQATADLYGIVMGTSHEAPMNRGIEEWNRHAVPAVRDAKGEIVKQGSDAYGGTGEWSYRRNRQAIEAYWRDGARRIGKSEVVVTLGMRGNGDTSLEDGAAIDLMQSIVRTERTILAEESKKALASIPQVWTLYKEVQGYWERGMRAPDDVTIVWCDDNWGNFRKLPEPALPARSGGYGLYYHFDYVGGSRNYKWVDTNLVPNVWEQLHLAYAHGIDNLWVVNVGDIKNVELPLQFFLDYAWSPERWSLPRLPEWERRFAAQQFGAALAEPIANLLHRYAQLQARRKPELLNRHITLVPTKDLAKDPDHAVVYDDAASPFSLTDYREFENVVEQWQALASDAERVQSSVPVAWGDAYYELVYYEIKATALLYELRFAEFTNLLYAKQHRSATNDMATQTEELFKRSQGMADYYNRVLAKGKWNGFQTQAYLGYGNVERYGKDASWQQPEKNNVAIPDEVYPPVKRLILDNKQEMGVAVDGSGTSWPGDTAVAELPRFSPYQRQPAQYIEVFNRGTKPFEFAIIPARAWIKVTPPRGTVDRQVRAAVTIDWTKAPRGTHRVPIIVSGPGGSRVTVRAVIENPEVTAVEVKGFVESNGYVSIEADRFARAVGHSPVFWQRIADIGRTGSGVTSFPATAPSSLPGADSPRLEYEVHLFSKGPVEVWAYHSPRNNVMAGDGIRYAISLDDEAPVIVDVTAVTGAIPMNKSWERNTADNVTRTSTRHTISVPGHHVLKYWRVDPTMILQKLVVDTGGLKPSYLGPPESYFAAPKE